MSAARDLSLLAVELENPHGYGRVLLDENQQVNRIIEEADATPGQKEIKLINTGIYCINKQFLLELKIKIFTSLLTKDINVS